MRKYCLSVILVFLLVSGCAIDNNKNTYGEYLNYHTVNNSEEKSLYILAHSRENNARASIGFIEKITSEDIYTLYSHLFYVMPYISDESRTEVQKISFLIDGNYESFMVRDTVLEKKYGQVWQETHYEMDKDLVEMLATASFVLIEIHMKSGVVKTAFTKEDLAKIKEYYSSLN